MQGDVLRSQRGSANRISLVGILFVADSQAKRINQIAGRGKHASSVVWMHQVALDLRPNYVDMGM
jgi:hypothetical protein